MPNHYNKIDGWFDFQNIYQFALQNYPEGRFLELGTWLGKSTCFMAELIKEHNLPTKFFAVDNFIGASDAPNQLNAAKDLGGTIYHQFLKNMKDAGVLDYVIPLAGDSVLISQLFDDKSLDFIFIDANHSYEFVKKDLETWYPKLKDDGLIAGHDFTFEAVRKAVLEQIPQALHTGNSWIYSKSVEFVKK